MGRKKSLSLEEKEIIIKELGQKTEIENIAAKLNRHCDTIKRFLKSPGSKKRGRISVKASC